MKRRILAAVSTAVMFSLVSAASAEDTFTRVWTDWYRGTPGITYTGVDADGNPVEIKGDGTEYMTVTNVIWNQCFQKPKLSFYGICLKAPAGNGYSESYDPLVIGAGGFSVQTANERYSFATRTTGKVQVQLAADQTWTGVSGTKIGIGDDGHNNGYGYYSTARMEALEGVHNWTIDGQLWVFLFGTNSLPELDVTVTANARLFLGDKWTNGGVARENRARLGARTLILDGAIYNAASRPSGPMSGASITLNPDFDPQTVAEKIVLKNGGSLGFNNSSWSIPELEVDGSPSLTSALTNSVRLDIANTTVTFKNGARAAFTDAVSEGADPAKLTLAGSGTLAIKAAKWSATGGFDIGEGAVLEVGGTAGKEVYLMYPLTGEGKVRVASGQVVLPAMGDCGEDVSFEVAAGAKAVFAGSAGFDEDRISGEGEYAVDDLIVTDTVRKEETLTVNAGEILRVFGNGLTTATKLVLNGGTLRFERTATVASEVQVDWPSIVESVYTSATGTISGRIACKCRTDGSLPSVTIPVPYENPKDNRPLTLSGLAFLGPGTTVLAGGGNFAGDRDKVRLLRRANVHFTNGKYWFGWFESSGGGAAITLSIDGDTTDGYQADLCCVRDGGELEFKYDGTGETSRTAIWISGHKDGGQYALNPRRTYFDICTGGKVTIPRKRTVLIGSADSREDLRIRGGELIFDGASAQLIVGYNLTSLAVVTMESGLLSLAEPIYRSYSRYGDGDNDRRVPRGRILWKGGTIKLNSHFNKTLFATTSRDDGGKSPSNTDYLRVGVQFGGDGTLDLSEMAAPVVTNASPALEQVEWHGTGSLTVKGGHLVMTAVPKGVDLRIAGEGTCVEIADEAYAYDDAACVEKWSLNGYAGGAAAQNYACKDFPSTERSVTITNLVVAGTNVAFASKVFGITNRNVSVTGEWRVGSTLLGTDAVEVENMTFAEGSLLAVSRERDGAARNFMLSGTLAFPERMEATVVRPGGRQGPVLTAAEVTGPAGWLGDAIVAIEGSSVVFTPFGSILILR